MHQENPIIIHRGIDGLEFAIKANVSEDLAERLAALKAEAIDRKEDQTLDAQGTVFHVGMTGMTCYAYRLSTGPMGYNLGVKKPNGRDPWGMRVSFNALPLAIHGWEACVAIALANLAALGCRVRDEDISMGRLDYAVDVLFAEPFQPDPKNFVRHSRMKGRIKPDVEYIEDGTGTASVRYGSISGKQLAVYDKRAEVIAKQGKGPWWLIWNENLKKLGLPPISKDGTQGRIWRFEFRAGKNFLAHKQRVKTFPMLKERGGDVIQNVAQAIRYAQPTADQTRSRWPDYPAYALVRESLREGLQEMTSGVDASLCREVIRSELEAQLLAQMGGTSLAYAEAAGLNTDDWDTLPDAIGKAVKTKVESYGDELGDRIDKVRSRYRFLEAPSRPGQKAASQAASQT